MKLERILPQLLADITRHPRGKMTPQWSRNSWVHNIFRVWELIFWRREGIKAEMTSTSNGNGRTVYFCHSWESVFALAETMIREALAFRSRVPVRISIPILRTPQGFPIFASPYLFAIAYDAETSGTSTSTSPLTFSHTCTGSNGILWVAEDVESTAGGAQTTPTFNSVSMTIAGTTQQKGTSTSGLAGLYFLTGPATGSKTVSVGFSGTGPNCNAFAVSYSGASQTGQPDASNGSVDSGAGSQPTVTVTTVAANCWVVAVVGANSSLTGPNRTARGSVITVSSISIAYQDTNAGVNAGTGEVMSWSNSSAIFALCAASFSPAAAATVIPHTMRPAPFAPGNGMFKLFGINVFH